jgi:predicted permease
MRWLDRWKLRLRTLVRREQAEADLRREMEFHLQEQIAENRAKGMSAEEARYAALRAIGAIAQIQEQCRDQRGLHLIEITIQDVRYSLRSLRKSPGFTLVAVLSLALGSGANMAIFSLIDSILLNSLPVKNPQQLVFVRTNRVKFGNFMVSQTLLNRDLEQMQQAGQFDGFASTERGERLNFAVNSRTELSPGDFVSGRYFEVLGVNPVLGRTLLPADDSPAGNSADGNWPVMISYGLWQRRFGKDADVLGKRIAINTIPCVIVGVMPRNFQGLSIDEPADVMLPAIISKQVSAGSATAGFPRPTESSGEILARLKQGVAHSKAAAELTVIFRQVELADNDLSPSRRESVAKHYVELDSAARGSSMLRQRFSDPLRALMAAVALVMLIACANIAGLLLAKASARQKEIAVRLSLGSSRRRLMRQLLTESLILSVIGCMLGIAFAILAHKVTLTLGNGSSAGLGMNWDFRLFFFLGGVCALNALLFGLIPALRVSKVDPNEALKGSQASQQSSRLPFGRVMVVAQLAISLVLVVAAALFLGSLRNLYRVDLGFNSGNLFMATMDARLAGYDDTRATRLYARVLDELKRLPSVQSATLMDNPLLTGVAHLSDARVVGYVPAAGEDISNSWTVTYGVGPQFFTTLQMPFIEGRDFTDADKEGAPPVVVINEAMAKHYFQGKDPIGQKVTFGSGKKTAQIAGIVRNAHYFDVQDEKQETIFTPLQQIQIGGLGDGETLVVRTYGHPTIASNDIRAVLRRIDPGLPLFNLTTMTEQVAADLSTPRLMATLSSFFGALALILSAIGLYGVLAYGVTKRTGEIGIRMALGADRGSILKMILSETFQLLIVGVLAGLGLAWATSRLIKIMLYGLSVHDLRVFLISASILIVVALLASAIPARRAVRVDPIVALRYE